MTVHVGTTSIASLITALALALSHKARVWAVLFDQALMRVGQAAERRSDRRITRAALKVAGLR
jgi:hypothetical protein